MCLSKGISGGYLPLSIVLCSDTIYAAFLDDSVARAFLHSHSYTGNPLACRAALATLDIFEQDDVIAANRAKARAIGTPPRAAGRPPAGSPPAPARHDRGLRCRQRRPAFLAQVLSRRARPQALIRPIGNTVYLMPPTSSATTKSPISPRRSRARWPCFDPNLVLRIVLYYR
jgi:adenosylmethionine-8-amino-7-oxononanoate aminotransferase